MDELGSEIRSLRPGRWTALLLHWSVSESLSSRSMSSRCWRLGESGGKVIVVLREAFEFCLITAIQLTGQRAFVPRLRLTADAQIQQVFCSAP